MTLFTFDSHNRNISTDRKNNGVGYEIYWLWLRRIHCRNRIFIFHLITTKASVATVCGVEWNVYAAAFTPPQNGAIVRMDSVRTKAYLQNSETCMRNLHW